MTLEWNPSQFKEAMADAERARLKLRKSGGDLSWYAIQVVPQKELAAMSILKKVGVPCFVPVERKFPRKRSRHFAKGKRLELKAYPMFTSYVFAGFAGPTWLYELSRFPIVRGVVGFEGRPFRLPTEAVERLYKMSDASIPWRSAPNPHKSFRPGDTADVIDGAYAGHRIEIRRIQGKFATFMLEFLGEKREMKTEMEFLESAG